MIDLYFRPTANGHKITIFLEEAGLPYTIVPMETVEGGHFGPTFLPISPNNKIPAIVDHDPAGGGPPINLFESGAILIYLAEKTGKFLSTEPRPRATTLQWLMWQMSGLGPASGQAGHFIHQAPQPADPYATERFLREVGRLYAVLDYRLKGREYISDSYSIADMACHPWITRRKIVGLDLQAFPELNRWWRRIGARPAVQRAYGSSDPYRPSARLSDEAHTARYRQTAEMIRAAYEQMETKPDNGQDQSAS